MKTGTRTQVHGDGEVGNAQDLAALVAVLLLLVGLQGAVVDDRELQRNEVVGDRHRVDRERRVVDRPAVEGEVRARSTVLASCSASSRTASTPPPETA